MCSSDKRSRQYASGASKRSEKKRKLEIAVANTSKIDNFFNARSSSSQHVEDDQDDAELTMQLQLSKPETMTTADPIQHKNDEEPCVVQQFIVLDLSEDNPTDRAHFSTFMSPELRDQILNYGPCRPKGPLPLHEEHERRVFSDKHYHVHNGAMQIERLWLCFSPKIKRPFCQSCWLFGDPSAQQKEWVDGVPGTPKNYGNKIKLHEKSQAHRDASSSFGRWKAGQRIDRDNEKLLQKETNFWRQVLHRIINIVMTLATMSLAFRGHREHVGDGSCYGGNFLALVSMQASFDPILQDLLRTPARTAKYLSAVIQNELIQLISNNLRKQLIAKIQDCPFFTIIVDTTSDITRADQISIIVRWVCIESDTITIKETFMGFIHTTNSTAAGFSNTVSQWLLDHGLDLRKIRGQGYDGASVMSGKKEGFRNYFETLSEIMESMYQFHLFIVQPII